MTTKKSEKENNHKGTQNDHKHCGACSFTQGGLICLFWGISCLKSVRDFVSLKIIFPLQKELCVRNLLRPVFVISATHIFYFYPSGSLKITFWFRFNMPSTGCLSGQGLLNINRPGNRHHVSHKDSVSQSASHVIPQQSEGEKRESEHSGCLE